MGFAKPNGNLLGACHVCNGGVHERSSVWTAKGWAHYWHRVTWFPGLG